MTHPIGSARTLRRIHRLPSAWLPRSGPRRRMAIRTHTTDRCRAMQVSSTSPPSRFHQLPLEKISTSL